MAVWEEGKCERERERERNEERREARLLLEVNNEVSAEAVSQSVMTVTDFHPGRVGWVWGGYREGGGGLGET